MACVNHRWDCYCEDDRLWAEQGAKIERELIIKRLDTLGANLEAAASMAAMHRIGYTRGFQAGRLLAEFCEDYVPEPYFPMADTRPTAERLGWEYCKHMQGAEGSCARCEGT